jgi:hypothetical protein
LSASRSSIALYREFAASAEQLPTFAKPWWLDATAGPNGWGVVCAVDAAGLVQAALPYAIQQQRSFSVLGMPPLSQTLGPWLRPSPGRESTRLAREKDLIGELLDALPPTDCYAQSWHHSITNWLPAYWRGYSQTTHYTYRIPSLVDLDAVWNGMQSNIRSDVRKARERFGVTVDDAADLEAFSRLNDLTFARQGKPSPYSNEFLSRVDAAADAQSSRRIFVARDEAGRAHAGVYLVWDSESAYYLMGGGDPELRHSGATSLCMWEAIRFAATVTRSFDFEGSMIEPVERFFRAFGAIQTPYFAISRTTSWQLRCRRAIRDLLPRRKFG